LIWEGTATKYSQVRRPAINSASCAVLLT